MDEIVNKCLLLGDKFISKMHLKQPRFTYSACRPLKFKETGDSRYIYQNKLDKIWYGL